MSASDPESKVPSQSEPQQKTVAPPIYAYAVSWKWLVVGLIGILGLAGIAGTMYSLQTSNMSTRVLDVVQRMVEESDRDKAKFEQVSDQQEKGKLILHSFKIREDAANLLNNYRQSNQAEAGSAVLEKLYDILESLYTDYGGRATANGRERGEQLGELAVELINIVSDAESIKYRTRLLELAWDRRYYTEIISRGLALLSAAQAAGDTGSASYDAMRYIGMAFYDNLPAEPYQRSLNKLPTTSFPETMDELLKKLNDMKPEDIEIAKRYAGFLVNIERANFSACASDALREKTVEERLALAKTRIDDMVQRNQEDPTAYIVRHHFMKDYVRRTGELDQADLDLEMVRKLAPTHLEGLILSGQDALQQKDIATRNNEQERALEWQNKAEEYFRSAIKGNPTEPLAYQYLGDFLFFSKRQSKEAIDVWNQGLTLSNYHGDEELVGRLVMVLLGQNSEASIEEVRKKLEHLTRTIAEMQFIDPMKVRRTTDMLELLTAQLYYTESNIAFSKIRAAMRENRPEEARRLSGIVQQKQGDALQKYDHLLRNFGKAREDYNAFTEKSVYNLLVPQSLMQAGELHAKWNQWDAAISYFERALPFEAGNIRLNALIALAEAYRQRGQFAQVAERLKIASDLIPNNVDVRYNYADALFRSQSASNNPNPATLDIVQKELDTLDSQRSAMPMPWRLDILRIHLGLVRTNISPSADNLEAMNEAIRQFRALERGTFPPDAQGNVKNYIDDSAFVSQLAGIYSGLSANSDFDRLLLKLREFPEGESAYYMARIGDFARRDDNQGVAATIDEALSSTRLSVAQKEQFASLLQSLKENTANNVSPIEKYYEQLKTTFDESPETLTPPSFFRLSQMSLDHEDIDQAKRVMERLKKIEGPEGRYWQYIEVRLMLTEQDPDYITMRQKQEAVVKIAPEWDEAYLLRALIDEHYLAKNPEDTEVLNQLIASYQLATQNNSVNPAVWRRLINLLNGAGRTEESNEVGRMAALRGVSIQPELGQLPQPYGRMYTQIQEAIRTDDAINADRIARQCIALAERRSEKPELVFSLNILLGKAFMDASMYESAIRHLSATAKRGGTNVYPLALCVAKSGDIDGGITLLLNEIDLVPSAMPTLLPSVLILLTQVRPSEAVYERIDRLMERIEQGENLTFQGIALDSEGPNVVPLASRWASSRKLQSLVIRFPGKTEKLDPSSIQFIDPVELKEEVPVEPPTAEQVPEQVSEAQPAPPQPVPPQVEEIPVAETPATEAPVVETPAVEPLPAENPMPVGQPEQQ